MQNVADLRGFLAKLAQEHHLVYVDREVVPRYELPAVMYKAAWANEPALFFRNVKGSRFPVVGNVCASRERLAWALNCQERDLRETYRARIAEPLPSEIAPQGPCQEVVEGEVNLAELPIITTHEYDAGAYITCGVVIAKHPISGIPNLSLNRMQVIGKSRVAVSIGPAGDLEAYRQAAPDSPLPVAVAIGVHPALFMAAAAKFPIDVNEYEIAGALLGRPVQLVKARTVDLEVPATAEIILEGEISADIKEMEGPFGEFPGYYGAGTLQSHPAPVISFTGWSHRHQAIYQVLLCGPNEGYEGSYFQPVAREGVVFAACQAACPAVKDVRIDYSRYYAFIQLKGRRHPGDVGLVMSAAFGINDQLKYLVVVDDDVDIDRPADVFWAMATRVDPGKDLYIYHNQRMVALDPATDGVCDKIGFDATIPLDKDGKGFTRTRIPGVEKVDLRDYLPMRQQATRKS